MVQLDKRYFPLKEIAKRWGLRKRDLVYMAEVGELRTSVRIPGAHIEVGMLEASQDQRVRVRYERIWFTGLQDLTTEDAFLVFRNGEADVREFHTGIADEYICIMPPSPAVRVTARAPRRPPRRAGQDRGEASRVRPFCRGGPRLPAFARLPLRPLGEAVMVLGVVQARIVRILHQAADSHHPLVRRQGRPPRGGRRLAPDGGRVQVASRCAGRSSNQTNAATTGCDPSRNRCGDGGITIPQRTP